MKRLLHSLSFRLALTYVGLFCLSVGLLIGFYYWSSVAGPFNDIKAEVDRDARELARTYIVDGEGALEAALEKRATRPSLRKPFHAFIDRQGRVLTANLPSWPNAVSSEWVEIEADVYRDGDETDHHAITRDRAFEDGARLLVGRDAEDIAELRERLQESVAWIFGGTVLLGLIGGLFMRLAIRARIEAVNQAARTVMAGDLSGRIPVRGTGDDFDRLGETLNHMLARIEELFDAVRRVSDNVAHELRTPLMRLMVQLERAQLADTDPDKRNELLSAAIAEARRLHRVFDALLRIARIESGRYQSQMKTLDAVALVRDVAELHSLDAERQGIRLEVAAPAQLDLVGDPDLLFQAISNLLDNALKYSPEGGIVSLTVEQSDARVSISVADDGPGLDDEEAARVTERFFRGKAGADQPGEGLGLSLVAAIASLHGAELIFARRTCGLRAEIVFWRHTPARGADHPVKAGFNGTRRVIGIGEERSLG